MATYSLSGSGVQALSANVTALHVSITTLPAVAGFGRANPAAYYDVGLLRFGDGTGYWAPFPVHGGPEWFGVPPGTTHLGYGLIGAAVISVVEVIGGISPFVGPAGSAGATGATGAAGAAGATGAAGAAGASGSTATNTNSQAFLGSNVNLSSTTTYFDGPSLSLAAGTWLITAAVTCSSSGGATSFVAKLWDGTTVYASGEADSRAGTRGATVHIHAIVVLASTTTVKVSATSDDTASIMRTNTSIQGSGNNATYINAVKLA